MRNDTITSFFAGNRKKGDRTSVMVTSARKIEENNEGLDMLKQPLTLECLQDGSVSIQVSADWKTALDNLSTLDPNYMFNLSYKINDRPMVQIDIEHGDWRAYHENFIMYEELKAGDRIAFFGQNPWGVGVDCWAPALSKKAGAETIIPDNKADYTHFTITSGVIYNNGNEIPASGLFKLYGNLLSVVDWDHVEKEEKSSVEEHHGVKVDGVAYFEKLAGVKMNGIDNQMSAADLTYVPSFAWLFHNTDPNYKIAIYDCQNFVSQKGYTGAYSLAGLMFEQTQLVHGPKDFASRIGFRQCESCTEGCSSLDRVVNFHTSSIAHGGCYRMFANCTSLAHVATMPFQTMGTHACESMFEGCTALTTTPVLRAEYLSDYCGYRMFAGCTNLVTVNELSFIVPAKHSCEEMFKDCKNLNYISVPKYVYVNATVPENAFTNWMAGVEAIHGTFLYAKGSEWPQNVNGNLWPNTRYEFVDPVINLDNSEPKVIKATATCKSGHPLYKSCELAVRLKGGNDNDWVYGRAALEETKIGADATITGLFKVTDSQTKVYEAKIVINRGIHNTTMPWLDESETNIGEISA